IKVLFLTAGPITMTTLRLGQEGRQIKERILASKGEDSIEFIDESAVSRQDLHLLLLKHDPPIVHFSGHGSEKEGLYFESRDGTSERVSQEALVELFGHFKDKIRLVVLNACQTNTLAKALTTDIDYTIGSRMDIGDDAAIEFSAAFYQALGFGKS